MHYFGKMKDLHKTQQDLLNLLKETQDNPLSIREIQERLSISSPSLAHHHIVQLEKKGYLKRNPANPADYQILADEPERKIAYLNLYGMARCGPEGSILSGDPIDRIPIPTALLSFASADAFLVKARGNSMTPRINDGDLVIAKRAFELVDNQTVVCVNDGDVMIKKIHLKDDRNIVLTSLNPDNKLIQTTQDKVRVEGIVKGVLSKKF